MAKGTVKVRCQVRTSASRVGSRHSTSNPAQSRPHLQVIPFFQNLPKRCARAMTDEILMPKEASGQSQDRFGQTNTSKLLLTLHHTKSLETLSHLELDIAILLGCCLNLQSRTNFAQEPGSANSSVDVHEQGADEEPRPEVK